MIFVVQQHIYLTPTVRSTGFHTLLVNLQPPLKNIMVHSQRQTAKEPVNLTVSVLLPTGLMGAGSPQIEIINTGEHMPVTHLT